MGRGNLEVKCSWDCTPNVEVRRDGLIVGLAQLDTQCGLVGGKEVVPMARPEWDVAEQRARAWLKDNPNPPPAA